jgi:hypothetical protein
MSQIMFNATTKDGIPVEVRAGWDPPLQDFFLTIFRDSEEEEVLWSAIDFPSQQDKDSTDRLKQVLSDFGVSAPTEFWKLVETKHEGNFTHRFPRTDE